MIETPEKENARLRAVVESLQADLRWSTQARHRLFASWIRAEQRLDLWMPLGVVALALSWLTAVLS